MTSAAADHTLRRAVWLVAVLNLAYFGIEFAVARAIRVSLFADSIDFPELCPSFLKSRYRHFASASGQGREESI
jgi:Co/Zn/Cd efflux system component